MRKRNKKVTWVSDDRLCQVKLFLPKDSPSKVGLEKSDELVLSRIKTSHPSTQWQTKLSQIPLVEWRSPPKFELSYSWCVAAGEESEEKEFEDQRELEVLEALYPRASSIPPNPTVSIDVELHDYDDLQTPVVPLTELEDREVGTKAHMPPSFPITSNIPNNTHLNETTSELDVRVDSDVFDAAADVAHTIFKTILTSEKNFIDYELLKRILSSRELIEKIVAEYGLTIEVQNINVLESSQTPLQISPPSQTSRIASGIQDSIIQTIPKSGSSQAALPIPPPSQMDWIETSVHPLTAISKPSNSESHKIILGSSSQQLSTPPIASPPSPSKEYVATPNTQHINIPVSSQITLSALPVSEINNTSSIIQSSNTETIPKSRSTQLELSIPAPSQVNWARSNTSQRVVPFGTFSPQPHMIFRGPSNQQHAAMPHMLPIAAPHGSLPNNIQNMPTTISSQIDWPIPSQNQFNRMENNAHPSAAHFGTIVGHTSQQQLPIPPISYPPLPLAGPLSHIDYFRNLIRQHGYQRQEMVQHFGNPQNVQSDNSSMHHYGQANQQPKIMKPCHFYNTPQGCRNGATCAYQHHASLQQLDWSTPEVDRAKRMKFEMSD